MGSLPVDRTPAETKLIGDGARDLGNDHLAEGMMIVRASSLRISLRRLQSCVGLMAHVDRVIDVYQHLLQVLFRIWCCRQHLLSFPRCFHLCLSSHLCLSYWCLHFGYLGLRTIDASLRESDDLRLTVDDLHYDLWNLRVL